MTAVIGIDLGTTFSAAARIGADGRPVIIPNAEGEKITPSVIWFGTDPPTIGRPAKDEQRTGATDIAAFFKRSMGDPNYQLTFHDRDYTPTDLSTLVLQKIKADCEDALQVPVTHAVITVPAYFNNQQREATIEAGRRAGLHVPRIINEPTAAAFAYGIQQSGPPETCLVYDLGGGTFDISIVHITPDAIEILGTDGDHELGGKDWDDRIARYLANSFRDEFGYDPLDAAVSYQDLLVQCETVKQQLSTRNAVKVPLTFDGRSGHYELTRVKFEELTSDLMERTQWLTEQTLKNARLTWSDLTCVLLVGGSTRMPMVRSYVEQMSGKPPRVGVNVDEAVALGAAIQAALDMPSQSTPVWALGGTRRVQDVTSHSLGIIAESPDRSRYINSKIIAKNQPIPSSMRRPYQLRTRARGENVLEVYVTQGESDDPTQCSLLGKYRFSNITHVTGREAAVLEINYDYDQNGVVAVSAIERATEKCLPMTVEPIPGDLSWLRSPPPQEVATAHVTAYLAFDLSGSMSGHPLSEAQKAAQRFLSGIDLSHNSIGLMSFADTCMTNVEACQDASRLERGIAGLAIGSVGGSNDTDPFRHALGLLKPVEDLRYLIVLTDGVWSDQERAAREAKACHQAGIEIIAVGFGGADQRFLEEISTTSIGSFFTDLSKLVETFSTIAQAMTEGTITGQRGS